MTKVRAYLLDLGERILKTFLQVFIGTLFISGANIGPDDVVNAVKHWDSVEKAFVSGVAAVVALIMGLILGWVNGGTASALPRRVVRTAAGSTTLTAAIILVLAAIGFIALIVWVIPG